VAGCSSSIPTAALCLKIDRTVFSRISGASLAGIYAEMDPFFNHYYLAVKYSSSASFDRLIIYDWGIGEFTRISNSVASCSR
jgi:hypothetical protein